MVAPVRRHSSANLALHLSWVFGIDRQRLIQLDVDERTVPRPFGERGAGKLDEAGGRQDSRTLHDVVAQKAKVLTAERGLPVHRARLGRRADRIAEQRMPTVAVDATLRRLVPVPLTLPRVVG